MPEVNHRRSMPFSFIDAISASAACSAGIEYVGSIVPMVDLALSYRSLSSWHGTSV